MWKDFNNRLLRWVLLLENVTVVCMSKQCKTCRKRTQNAGKCAISVHFWLSLVGKRFNWGNNSTFDWRGMSSRSYQWKVVGHSKELHRHTKEGPWSYKSTRKLKATRHFPFHQPFQWKERWPRGRGLWSTHHRLRSQPQTCWCSYGRVERESKKTRKEVDYTEFADRCSSM